MSGIVKVREAQREVYKAMKALADELDDDQKKLDKAKLSFSTTGAGGGIMTIVGLALTPVTFGASLGLSIAGGVIGLLSAAGSISSLVADKILTSKTMKKAPETLIVLASENKSVEALLPRLLARLNGEELEDLKKRISRNKDINEETQDRIIGWIKSGVKELQDHCSTLTLAAKIGRTATEVFENIIMLSIALSKSAEAGKAFGGMAAGAGATANAANAGRTVGTVTDAGLDVAKTAGKVGLSGAKVAGIASAGVGLAFDVGGIVYYSIKVHKRKPCEVAENIRKASKFLE